MHFSIEIIISTITFSIIIPFGFYISFDTVLNPKLL